MVDVASSPGHPLSPCSHRDEPRFRGSGWTGQPIFYQNRRSRQDEVAVSAGTRSDSPLSAAWSEATAHCQTSIQICEKVGDPFGAACAKAELGYVLA